MEIREHYDVMERVCGRLVAAFDAKEYPYNQPGVQPPQIPENLPASLELGSQDHAMFLFKLCYWMRGGVESDTAIRSLGGMYSEYPEFFDPRTAVKLNPESISEILTRFGLGYAKTYNSRFWVDNSRLLIKYWDGDPRNIYHDFGSLSEKEAWKVACERIRNKGKERGFAGFREKMVSMLTYFLMASDLIPNFNFPLPVDFHVLRISLMHRFVVIDGGTGSFGYPEVLLNIIRELTYRYANEHNVDSLKLCDVIWLYSRSMCSNHPAFKSVIGERNGRSTPVSASELNWNNTQVSAHSNTCHACVIADTCHYIVRSAPYYIQCQVVVEDRSDCPNLSLIPSAINRHLIQAQPPRRAVPRAIQNTNDNHHRQLLLFPKARTNRRR